MLIFKLVKFILNKFFKQQIMMNNFVPRAFPSKFEKREKKREWSGVQGMMKRIPK